MKIKKFVVINKPSGLLSMSDGKEKEKQLIIM